ncbi:hypothetical protein [Anabaena azotica]|uniref:Uncharacterized protein n=1 Tax=Anabaena azotica FACHB-119 TaxID=947527 RepID=A0ABR8D9M8_9NOST|nr:hypothetical protein [Anabaena azotica]MBD2503897.1 hypothetical protein [Anabaena azotica FACHB-119]
MFKSNPDWLYLSQCASVVVSFIGIILGTTTNQFLIMALPLAISLLLTTINQRRLQIKMAEHESTVNNLKQQIVLMNSRINKYQTKINYLDRN